MFDTSTWPAKCYSSVSSKQIFWVSSYHTWQLGGLAVQCCDEHAEKVQSPAAVKQRKYYPPCLTEFHLKSRLRFHTLQHYFCTPFSQLLHLPFFRQKGKLCTPYTLTSCRTFISSGPFWEREWQFAAINFNNPEEFSPKSLRYPPIFRTEPKKLAWCFQTILHVCERWLQTLFLFLFAVQQCKEKWAFLPCLKSMGSFLCTCNSSLSPPPAGHVPSNSLSSLETHFYWL